MSDTNGPHDAGVWDDLDDVGITNQDGVVVQALVVVERAAARGRWLEAEIERLRGRAGSIPARPIQHLPPLSDAPEPDRVEGQRSGRQ